MGIEIYVANCWVAVSVSCTIYSAYSEYVRRSTYVVKYIKYTLWETGCCQCQ